MTTVVILTLVSQTHVEQGRYALSFDVIPKKKTKSVLKERKAEEQVYKEYASLAGGVSPEIELKLNNKQCDIKITVTGALKPQTEFDEGEDILEYKDSRECRKLLTFVPTYDAGSDGTATVKFKVEGKVKHTVHIHNVPTERPGQNPKSFDKQTSTRSRSSLNSEIMDKSLSIRSNASCQSIQSEVSNDSNDCVMAGSARESTVTSGGEANNGPDGKPQAIPVPPSPPTGPLNNLSIGDGKAKGPTVLPPDGSASFDDVTGHTAYDKILSNESLNTLAYALPPSDANKLVIGLGVPHSIHQINLKNHMGDVVTGNFESLRHWRSMKTSRRGEHEVGNKTLFEDLLVELDDIGRKDIKSTIKTVLDQGRKLEKRDFSQY